MKFFIPLDFRYSDHWSLGSVYGPYEDDKAVAKEIARLWPNEGIDQVLVFDGQIVNVKLSLEKKTEPDKREPGNHDNYIQNGDRWNCKDCGAIIMGAKIAHPIHLHHRPGVGFGECEYEEIPYCPNCDREPNFDGPPVYV